MIPGTYTDPSGMTVFPERPEELLAVRVESLERMVQALTIIMEANGLVIPPSLAQQLSQR